MPLDNSVNCSETNVTVMSQITGDAVYSGSDLFCMIVYSNELSQTKPPPLVTVAYISFHKLRFSSVRIRYGTQRSIAYMLRILVRTSNRHAANHTGSQSLTSLSNSSDPTSISLGYSQGLQVFTPYERELRTVLRYREDSSNTTSLPRKNSPFQTKSVIHYLFKSTSRAEYRVLNWICACV